MHKEEAEVKESGTDTPNSPCSPNLLLGQRSLGQQEASLLCIHRGFDPLAGSQSSAPGYAGCFCYVHRPVNRRQAVGGSGPNHCFGQAAVHLKSWMSTAELKRAGENSVPTDGNSNSV